LHPVLLATDRSLFLYKSTCCLFVGCLLLWTLGHDQEVASAGLFKHRVFQNWVLQVAGSLRFLDYLLGVEVLVSIQVLGGGLGLLVI
jgi:hypothetical protein